MGLLQRRLHGGPVLEHGRRAGVHLDGGGAAVPGGSLTNDLRPISVLRFLISEGLTHAASQVQGVEFSGPRGVSQFVEPGNLSRDNLSRETGRISKPARRRTLLSRGLPVTARTGRGARTNPALVAGHLTQHVASCTLRRSTMSRHDAPSSQAESSQVNQTTSNQYIT